jgi:LPXTG-motif cell wall-anchored protein
MNRLKVVATIFCLSLAALAFSASVKADAWNKKTFVTFSQPVEVPGGVVLPAGAYVFKLMDSASNRHIVQIFNEDQNHIYATVLAIPNYRLRVTGKTIITFVERPAGEPQAIRAWFYPGDNFGQEFVYSKRRAAEFAKQTTSPVPAAPSKLESEITKPATAMNEEPVVDMKQSQDTDVKPAEKEVEIAQAVEPPPVQTTPTPAQPEATPDAPERMEQLPQTASQLPFWGLIGSLSLGAGFALMWVLKRKKLAK